MPPKVKKQKKTQDIVQRTEKKCKSYTKFVLMYVFFVLDCDKSVKRSRRGGQYNCSGEVK